MLTQRRRGACDGFETATTVIRDARRCGRCAAVGRRAAADALSPDDRTAAARRRGRLGALRRPASAAASRTAPDATTRRGDRARFTPTGDRRSRPARTAT